MIKKDFRKDYYTGLKGVYFHKIIDTIIQIGGLREQRIKILDFGAGVGKLQAALGKDKVTNFDIIPELSEIKDWRKRKYDFIVANEVFEQMTMSQIDKFLTDLKSSSPKAKLIVGISRQNPVNNLLAVLGGESDAHVDGITPPFAQLETLTKQMRVVTSKTVFGLCDVYLLEFRN